MHTDNTPRNNTTTTAKPVAALTAEQKLQRLGKLNEIYLEKEADKKMKGIQNYIIAWNKHSLNQSY